MGIKKQKLSTPEEVCRAITADLRFRGITHEQAGKTIGKSRAAVSNLLSSKKRFSKTMAFLFASAFGYNTDYLLYGTGELMKTEQSVNRFTVAEEDAAGRVNITIRIAPETAAVCRKLKQEGVSVGKLIDDLLQVFNRHMSLPANEQQVF